MNNPRIEPHHNLTPIEADAIQAGLNEYNRAATVHGDKEGLAFVIRDATGRIVGAAAGHSWGGISELNQMWVSEGFRGRGHGRALLDAFVEESRRRGVRRVWLASYDFQAPGFYEKAGFKRMAEFPGWPEGHVNVLLCKEFPKDSGV